MKSRYYSLPSYKYINTENDILENNAGKPLRDYEIFGNIYQSFNSNNYLDLSKPSRIVGCETSFIDDVFTITKTSKTSANVYFDLGYYSDFENKCLNFYINNIGSSNITYYILYSDINGNFLYNNYISGNPCSAGSSKTLRVVIPKNKSANHLIVRFYVSSFDAATAEIGDTCILNNVQIKETYIDAYEQYNENSILSIDNPYEIQWVGTKTKNLYNGATIGTSLNADTGIECSNLYHATTDYIPFINGKTYYLSGMIANKLYATVFAYNKNYEFIARTASSYTETKKVSSFPLSVQDIEDTEVAYVRIRFTRLTESDMIDDVNTWNIQFELGDTYTSYKPYGYEIPIDIIEDNLFNDNYLYNSKYNIYDESTGLWTVSDASTGYYRSFFTGEVGQLHSRKIECLPKLPKNAKITVKIFDMINNTPQTSGVINYALINKDNTTFKHANASSEFTFTTPDIECWLDIRRTSSSGNIQFSKIQISVGDSADTYKEQKKRTEYIYIKEPLRRIGNYADNISFKNKKILRHIINDTLTATEISTIGNTSEDLALFSMSGLGNSIALNDIVSIKSPQILGVMYYDYINQCVNDNFFKNKECICLTDVKKIYFKLKKERIGGDTLELAQTYLNEHPIEIWYATGTPIEESIDLPSIINKDVNGTILFDMELSPVKKVFQYYKKG